ncbi:hypothetical protein B0H14DRAFT_3655271 [Mycena olivaceomarginata]|nr:hypothetical protein B0H14DRAFT_3655271 [Mycena olivaceomarginata]
MDSANANVPTTHTHQLSRRTVLDRSTSSLSSKSRRSKRSRKETRLTEDQGKVLAVHLDNEDKAKDNKRKDNTTENKAAAPDDATWHGWVALVLRGPRLSIPPPTALAHDPPSFGPFVDLDEYMKYIHTPDGRDCYPDSDDDDDDPSLSRRGCFY